MKLLEILVQELPKRGGWPVDKKFHSFIAQDNDGDLWAFPSTPAMNGKRGDWEIHSGDGCYLFNLAVADDNKKSIITREQYESALAASKPEWNGEGLPPVGSRVEVRAEDFEGGWVAIDVVYVHNGEVTGIVQSENEYLNDRLEKFSAGYNRAEFRPIRSEADKKRDDITQSILDVLNDYDFEMVHIRSDQKRIATDIVERIASSMIPHIRID